MNDYLLSVLLGIVEGLTEFLPVSSTAHLRIAEALLGMNLSDGYWKMYSIVIQLGAILCLPIYFRARIAGFLRTFPIAGNDRQGRGALQHPLSLVMIAFLFTAIPAFLLTRLIGKHLENLALMATALIVGGVIMWAVDARYGGAGAVSATSVKHQTESMEEMSIGQAIWIGVCQIASAVFPGTSRSMATIAAGQLAGMTRRSALEFSFFLSIPTMLAATLYDLLKSLRHPPAGADTSIGSMTMDAHAWIVLAIGFVVSFIVAYGVVAWFMGWVRQRGFAPFAIYRIVVGAAVLIWVLRG